MNTHPSRVTTPKPSTFFAPLRKWLFAALAAFTAVGAIPQANAQTTTTLIATRDAELYNDSPNTNYGSCNFMYVGANVAKKTTKSIGVSWPLI